MVRRQWYWYRYICAYLAVGDERSHLGVSEQAGGCDFACGCVSAPGPFKRANLSIHVGLWVSERRIRDVSWYVKSARDSVMVRGVFRTSLDVVCVSVPDDTACHAPPLAPAC